MPMEKFELETTENLPLVGAYPQKGYDQQLTWNQVYPVNFESQERSRKSKKAVLIPFVSAAIVCFFGLWLWKYYVAAHYAAAYRPLTAAGEDFTADTELQVNVDQGTLQGKRLLSRGGRNYLAFLGIPFAQPPVRNLRFMPPVAADSWEGVRDATYFRSICIEKQRIGNAKLEDQPDITVGSEDCLYLNVYTPKEPRDLNRGRNRLPVLVYIHGGAGGAFGSGQMYGADYFMDEDVILVTLEFRLGVFGNLNTNTSLASGNQGLKDQVMALEWIQDNIQKFGGDRRRVTIMGNSFGGIQVSSHMLSPMSEGLFHRAIAQSGSILYPGFFTENPLYDAQRLGDLLNCSYDDSSETRNKELTECLINSTASDLVIQGLKLKHKYNYVFTISRDTASEPGNIFLPAGPVEGLQNGNLRAVPYLTGIVEAEGLKDSLEVMTDPTTLEQFQSNWTQILIPSLYLQYTVKNSKRLWEMSSTIGNFYLGEDENGVQATLGQNNFRNFTNMYTDRLYTHPAATMTSFLRKKYNETSRDRTRSFFPGRLIRNPSAYFYQFTHEVNKSRADPLREEYDGMTEYFGECHADELQFFFPFPAFPYIPLEHPYANFSKMVVKLWANFAKNGVPSGTDNKATWLPVSEDHPYQYFDLNDEPKMVESTLDSRIQFWNNFNLTELYFY